MSKNLVDFQAEYGYLTVGPDCEVATFTAKTNHDANKLLAHVSKYAGTKSLAWVSGQKTQIIVDLNKTFMDESIGSKIKYALMTFDAEDKSVEVIHLHKKLVNCTSK